MFDDAICTIMDMPTGTRKMTDSQKSEDEHDGPRPETESPARPPRVSKLPERSPQQPIAALEHDRCSRDGDPRQRIPLLLDNWWEEPWGLPHAFLRGDYGGSMPPRAGTDMGAPGRVVRSKRHGGIRAGAVRRSSGQRVMSSHRWNEPPMNPVGRFQETV